jgi:hypothetical protein
MGGLVMWASGAEAPRVCDVVSRGLKPPPPKEEGSAGAGSDTIGGAGFGVKKAVPARWETARKDRGKGLTVGRMTGGSHGTTVPL